MNLIRNGIKEMLIKPPNKFFYKNCRFCQWKDNRKLFSPLLCSLYMHFKCILKNQVIYFCSLGTARFSEILCISDKDDNDNRNHVIIIPPLESKNKLSESQRFPHIWLHSLLIFLACSLLCCLVSTFDLWSFLRRNFYRSSCSFFNLCSNLLGCILNVYSMYI